MGKEERGVQLSGIVVQMGLDPRSCYNVGKYNSLFLDKFEFCSYLMT